MRWLVIQSASEREVNFHLRECFAIGHALENADCDVTIWGLRHGNYASTPDFESFDAILTLENYEMNWLPDFSKIKKPVKLSWAIDLHCNDPSNYLKVCTHCDYILHATKSYIPSFSQLVPNAKHLWFPNAVDDRYFRPNPLIDKKYDAAFIGSPHPWRLQWMRDIEKRLGVRVRYRLGEEMLNEIRETKVHLNKSIKDDIPYRVFETIGLGTCLLTNTHPDMPELGFKHKENCLLYSNVDEIGDLIRYAVDNNMHEKIGKAGAELALKHTYTVRIKKLLGVLNNGDSDGHLI